MASRGRTLILSAAALTLLIGLVVGGGALWVLHTRSGAELIRGRVVAALEGSVQGRVHVGAIRGSILGAPVIDSVEIRDADDSVLVATGPISFEYDLLDVWDKRIVLRNVVVTRPFVHLRQDTAGVWNYKRAFTRASSEPRPAPRAPTLGHKFGDVVLLDTVTVVGGEFRWTEPWEPDDDLRGAARDSAIAHNLARTDADIQRLAPDSVAPRTQGRRPPDQFIRVRHWRDLRIEAPSVRIRHPDTTGIAVRFSRFDVDEFDPPFRVRRARGEVLVARDTVRVRVDAFRLPGSSGSASGYLVTRNGLGVRVRVIGDTVSMADIAWIYPTLPTEGGGRLTLDIRKDSSSSHIDYALSAIDVRSTASHLLGAMTFGVGDHMLEVKNVDLTLSPVDFKLIEQFSGGPLPLPWAGQLRGRVRGPGGPLDQFVVEQGDIEFTDANVPGVVNVFRGGGTLNIETPAEAVFQDFALDVVHFDLRTARALNAEFPPWAGWVSGSARLDSAWFDVRFRDGDIRYYADSGSVNRFYGGGRVTVEETELRYDLALVADSLDLTSLALSYPEFGLRGKYAGAFSVAGTMGDLRVSGDLSGAGGRVRTTNLRLDALEPRYAVTGQLQFNDLDPSLVLGDTALASARLQLNVEAAVAGDSLADLQGAMRLTLGRSLVEGVRVHHGVAALRFDDGIARVDSVTLQSDALSLGARGGIGLRRDRHDSLLVRVDLDSLGGLRGWLERGKTALPDSMRGVVNATARLLGNVDSLDARVVVQFRDLIYGANAARRGAVTATLSDIARVPLGRVVVEATDVGVGTIALSAVDVAADVLGRDSTRVVARATSATGPVIEGGAGVVWDSLAVRTALDSLRLRVGGNTWSLARPATITSFASGDVVVDSITLRTGARTSVTIAASLPDRDEVRGVLTAQDFPLGDLGQLVQTPVPLSGSASLRVGLAGTRDAPRLDFELLAQDAHVGEAHLEGLRIAGDYADRELRPRIEYRRSGVPVLRGEARLPMDLAFRPVASRLLDSPLSGALDADSTNLAVLESFSSAIARATGYLDAHLRFSGTWKAPAVQGPVRVINGAFSLPRLGSVRYEDVRAQIRFLGDSIQIDTLMAQSGDAASRARVFGWMSFADVDDPRFGLRVVASRFRAIANRDIAELFITTDAAAGLRLEGRKSGSSLVGGLEINGTVHIPESYSKSIVALDERDFIAGIDTSAFASRRLLPTTMSTVIDNLRIPEVTVRAGDNLWLRSDEANVKLGGQLRVTVGTSARASDRGQRQLALDGSLIAEQGTYRLSLGPVQRTFVVENGGTVSFFGDPDLNPSLAITALHTVRQYDPRDVRPDVRVRATIGGTLLQPTVELSSPDSLRISGADLYSYLITGAPSIEIGGRASDYASTGASVLVSSLGSLIAGRFVGRGVDYLDISTASLEGGYSGGVRRVGTGILASTRVNTGIQLTDRLFARIDGGLCQFSHLLDQSGQTSFDAAEFASALGLKLDIRFAGGLGASVGLDPASAALTCAEAGTTRGIVPTPPQFGLDIFRRWRF